MSRTPRTRLVPAVALALAATLAACGGSSGDVEPAASATPSASADAGPSATPSTSATASTSEDAATFPVTVTDDTGEVQIVEQPDSIVSLSPAATEMLFAIGAGDQVVAVDDLSTFPAEAPTTDLSAFEPNVEAILGYEPDLVVSSGFTDDVQAAFDEADVPVLQYAAAADVEDAFAQFRALGTATGTDAEATVEDIRTQLDEIAAGTDVEPGLTYYHELSSDLYTATSDTFIGSIYGLFDMENIADEAGEDAGDYPQLSAEYIVEQDPDYVFLACTVFCGETTASFGAREAFSDLGAVQQGDVVELDDDVASRWGPRMVEFAQSVATALQG